MSTTVWTGHPSTRYSIPQFGVCEACEPTVIRSALKRARTAQGELRERLGREPEGKEVANLLVSRKDYDASHVEVMGQLFS